MPRSCSGTVAGIDVGGDRKGFHGVAFRDGRYLTKCAATEVDDLVRWCTEVEATVIGIDAPCHWSRDGRARPAERQLMQKGVWCFATPTRAMALAHRSNHFGWMLQGEALYRALASSHPLLEHPSRPPGARSTFETFPHAIACQRSGTLLSAKNKRRDRAEVLRRAGVMHPELTNIDWIDAALCALTAHGLASEEARHAYGDDDTGWIIVP